MKDTKKVNSTIVEFFSKPDADIPVTETEVSEADTDKKREVVSKTVLTIRSIFASSAEKSFFAKALEYLYYGLLSCRLSVIAMFLGVFGFTSFSIDFAVSPTVPGFISNSSNWISVIFIAIAILFAPIKKTLSELLSQSVLFSQFEFSYDRKVFNTSKKKYRFYDNYSSAFFLGILAGIVSVLFTPIKVFVFTLCVAVCLIIFNRPESGMLLCVFFLPFIKIEFLNVIVAFTFFSLLYKYFRKKRHMSFGIDEMLLVLCCLMFVLTGFYNVSGSTGLRTTLTLCIAVASFICVKNLIKSISLFNNSVRLISYTSRILAVVTLVIYLATEIPAIKYINQIHTLDFIEHLTNYLNSNNYIPLFIATTIPLNLSLAISRDNNKLVENLFLIIQYACVITSANIYLIFASVFGTVSALSFHKKKLIFVMPFIPVLAFLLIKVSQYLPTNELMQFNFAGTMGHHVVSSLLREYPFFGIGLGSDNLVSCISPYASIGTTMGAFPTTLSAILVCFGIPCSIFLICVIFYFLIKNLKNIIKTDNMCIESKRYASGLICVCATMLLLGTCIHYTSMSAAVFLAICFSLCGCFKECITADYIDNNRVRQ